MPAPQAPSAPKNWKLLVFEALAVLLAGAVGYGCLLYFSGGVNFLLFAVTAACFLLASFFSFLFARDRRRRMIAAFLQILAFLAFFYAAGFGVLCSAFGILVVFYFLAGRRADALAENSLKFKLGPLARAYMKKIFLGFAVAAIILYLPQWNSGTIFVPQPQFQRWYEGFANIGEKFHAGINFRSSVGAFAENIVRVQLSTNPQFDQLPAAEKEKVVRKAVQEMVSNTGKNAGIALTADMPLAEAFYRYLFNLFSSFKTQFGDSFLAAWAVALFVIVWSVGSLVIWLVVAAAYLLFELFAAFNLVHIAGEACTKEVIQLS